MLVGQFHCHVLHIQTLLHIQQGCVCASFQQNILSIPNISLSVLEQNLFSSFHFDSKVSLFKLLFHMVI